MNYTVNQLAKVSNVTVRTLRFYDEIGLLKPACIASNGYRVYREQQLLQLQQILFFRELGFELKQIQEIIGQNDFDQLAALRKHKKMLRSNITRMNTLMKTVDTTIQHLEGKQAMNGSEMFRGFAKAQEEMKTYQTQMMKVWNQHVGAPGTADAAPQNLETNADWHEYVATTLEALKHMPADILEAWLGGTQQGTPEFDAKLRKHYEMRQAHLKTTALFAEMADTYAHGAAADSAEMQSLVAKHHELYKASMPTKESYIGGSKFYADPISETTFKNHPAGFAAFLAQAMVIFAQRHLS